MATDVTAKALVNSPNPSTPSKNAESTTADLQSTTQIRISHLSYATVRDFAYPPSNPLHYGPPAASSVGSTPASARNSGLFSGANGLGSILGWWNQPSASPT